MTPEQQYMAQLHLSNQQRVQILHTQGVNPDAGIIHERLNEFIDFIFGELDTEQEVRQSFELRFQERLSKWLGTIESEVRKSQLMQGVNGNTPRPPL